MSGSYSFYRRLPSFLCICYCVRVFAFCHFDCVQVHFADDASFFLLLLRFALFVHRFSVAAVRSQRVPRIRECDVVYSSIADTLFMKCIQIWRDWAPKIGLGRCLVIDSGLMATMWQYASQQTQFKYLLFRIFAKYSAQLNGLTRHEWLMHNFHEKITVVQLPIIIIISQMSYAIFLWARVMCNKIFIP